MSQKSTTSIAILSAIAGATVLATVWITIKKKQAAKGIDIDALISLEKGNHLIEYPAAKLVSFDLMDCFPVLELSNHLARKLMKKADYDFHVQLLRDDSLYQTFNLFCERKINGEYLKEHRCAFSQILTIDRALKNRLFLAVRQKREINSLILRELIPKSDRKRVRKEAIDELRTVVELVSKWPTKAMIKYYREARKELEVAERLWAVMEQGRFLTRQEEVDAAAEAVKLAPSFSFPTVASLDDINIVPFGGDEAIWLNAEQEARKVSDLLRKHHKGLD